MTFKIKRERRRRNEANAGTGGREDGDVLSKTQVGTFHKQLARTEEEELKQREQQKGSKRRESAQLNKLRRRSRQNKEGHVTWRDSFLGF